MTKKQALGQLRELLSAAGAVLATWGYSDGQQWAPIVGIIVILYSLTWGVLHHKDPLNPGVISWSLVRKAVNVIGTAIVTYGFMDDAKFHSIEPIFGALGPLVAMQFSWISNTTPEDDGGGDVKRWTPLIMICLIPMSLIGCATKPVTKITPDGCAMLGQKIDGYRGTVWLGACADSRIVAEWQVTQPDWEEATIRATRHEDKEIVISYLSTAGWVEWSSESGVMIGVIPIPLETPVIVEPKPSEQ